MMKDEKAAPGIRPIKYITIPDNKYIIVFVDGSNFRTFTKDYERPFDVIFHKFMVELASDFLTDSDLYPTFSYTHSDEISIVLHKDTDIYNRRAVKILSEAVAFASERFRKITNRDKTKFHGDVIYLDDIQDMYEYFEWRRKDCFRMFINNYSLYKTIEFNPKYKNTTTASKFIEKLSFKERIKLIADYGIDIDKLPEWQRQGSTIMFEEYIKEGFNPITEEKVRALRRRPKLIHDVNEAIISISDLNE